MEKFLNISVYGSLKMTRIGKLRLLKFGSGKTGQRNFRMMILELILFFVIMMVTIGLSNVSVIIR